MWDTAVRLKLQRGVEVHVVQRWPVLRFVVEYYNPFKLRLELYCDWNSFAASRSLNANKNVLE